MVKLYHYGFCPRSRLIRVLLKEHLIEFEEEKIEYWREKEKVLKIDPLGELPFLQTSFKPESNIDSNNIVAGLYPVTEYIMDISKDSHLFPASIEELASARRMIYWISSRFHKEVTGYFINEKLIKLLSLKGAANTEYLRVARGNLIHHSNYFRSLFDKNGYLATGNLSYADIYLACHISILDYFGEVNWDKLFFLKNWYASIKSRPSFREILKYRLSIISPPDHYEDPDF
jgi:glutathione S-transferase